MSLNNYSYTPFQEIITPGIEAGLYRSTDPVESANILMTLYLGIASQVTDEGVFYISAAQVADFAKHALRR